MNDSIYLAFLAGVGRNSATFATITEYSRHNEDNVEVRTPSLCSQEQTNIVLYEFDKAAHVIENWTKLYAWLGSIGTWKAFTKESAAELVPHWFSPSTEYACRLKKGGPADFVAINSEEILNESLPDLSGGIDSADGRRYLAEIKSNLVLTTLPLFTD